MSDFWRLLRKEFRELLRPRYLLPLLVAPLIFFGMAQGFGGVEEQLADRPPVGVVNADGDEYGALVNETLANRTEVVYYAEDGDVEAAVSAVRERGGEAVVVIGPNFTERIRAGKRGTVEVHSVIDEVSLVGIESKVPSVLRVAAGRITIEETGASPAQLSPVETERTSVVEGRRIDASPGQIGGAFATQIVMIPVAISVVVLFAGQMVMNSMGVEKENKTLETLLTMPVDRRTIVLAKLVGSATIGLAGAGLYTASLFYYQSEVAGGGAGIAALQLSALDYLLIGTSLGLALVGALAGALCLGLFADDRQGAQSLLLPLSALAFVPVGVTVFTEVSALSLPLRVLVYAIPFTHPVIAPKQLLFGDPLVVYAGIAYEALFAVAMVALAVRIFESDRPVTGSTGRLERVLGVFQR